MAYQISATNNSFGFILNGVGYVKDNETLLTQGSRTVALKQFTLMAQVASSRKWVPWLNANLGGTTGTQYPMGIYLGDDIAAATIAAGDVTGAPILYMGQGLEVDGDLVVFDGGDDGLQTKNALTSIPTVPTNLAITAEQFLAMKGIAIKTMVAGDNLEN